MGIEAERNRHWASPPANNAIVDPSNFKMGELNFSSALSGLDRLASVCPPSFQWDQSKGQCLAECKSGPSTNRTKAIDFGGPGWCIEDNCTNGFYKGSVFSLALGGPLLNAEGFDKKYLKNQANVCYPSVLACPSGKTFDRLSLYCSDQPVPKADSWGVFNRG